tara:strand:- start:160454 stop:160918 length:465 start_codon:yes stop_codon:yes gene_type:complete
MIEIALYQPEIPPNTGNIIRLCANIGSRLHLIHPLGFEVNEKKVRRAGCDYHELTHVVHHENYAAFEKAVKHKRIIAIETWGETAYTDIDYTRDDVLLLGSESKGIPRDITDSTAITVNIPMVVHNRSLNLSNSAAIVAYEAWRQLGFSLPIKI